MERATELHWLKWFYQAADIGLTEEDRIELERRFVKEENLLIPKAYEIDDNPIPMYDTFPLKRGNVMKVYVVLKEYKGNDEGCSWPFGVFSTRQKAEEFIKKQEDKFKPRGYFWEIDSFEVDKE